MELNFNLKKKKEFDPNRNRFANEDYGLNSEIITEDQRRAITIKAIIRAVIASYVITAGILLVSYLLSVIEPIATHQSIASLDQLLSGALNEVLNHVYALVFLVPGLNILLSLATMNAGWISTSVLHLFIYLLVLVPTAYILIKIAWQTHRKIKVIEESKINKNQLGDSRFTKPEELVKQYEIVPDRTIKFDGYGGLPISHLPASNPALQARIDKEGKIDRKEAEQKGVEGYYLVTLKKNPTNSVVLGTTRSGKGEQFVKATIDSLSRASHRPSLLITDPKGELFRSTNDLLRSRNYDTYVVNLDNMNFSNTYDPLAQAKFYLLRNNLDEAVRSINEVALSLYPKPVQGSAFFAKSSRNLFTGIVLGIVWHQLRAYDKKLSKVTMHNVIATVTMLGGTSIKIEEGQQVNYRKIDDFFEQILAYSKQPNADSYLAHIGEQAYQWYNLSGIAGDRQRGVIYSDMVSELALYLQGDISRLTTKSSFNLRKFGFPRQLYVESGPQYNRIKLEIAFIINDKEVEKELVLTDDTGRADIDFSTKFTYKDKVVVQIRYYRAGENQELNYDVHRERLGDGRDITITPESENYPFKINIDYDDRPVALFAIIPASRTAYNTIAAFLINQLYMESTMHAAHTNNGKTYYPIVVVGDEWNNIPAIPEFDNKLSQGLGIGFTFNIFLQSRAGLKYKYGHDKSEILWDNLNTKIFLTSSESDTRKWYSDSLGEKTVVLGSKTGQLENLNEFGSEKGMSQSERLEGRPLLTSDQLGALVAGETVVIRSGDRIDKDGNKIVQYPIFNTGEMELPQSHDIHSYIDTGRNMLEQHLYKQQTNINLDDYEIDYSDMNFDDDLPDVSELEEEKSE